MKWILTYAGMILLTLFTLNPLHAQHKKNVWFRITVDQPVSKRWNTSLELHHRRQSSVHHKSPLQSSLLYAVRPWIHYSLNHSVQISTSPLAYYHQLPLLMKDEDGDGESVNEWRTSLGLSVHHLIGKRFTLKERTLWEYRHFSNDVQTVRSRFKLGIEYQVRPSWYVTLHEETMLNIHHTEKPMHFDQERINLNIRKVMNKHVALEMELAHVIRNINSLEEHLKESNLLLHVHFKI